MGRRINLPLQYDFERLSAKLINEGYKDYDLFKRFYSIYTGWADKAYIEFIHKNFPEECFISYYKEKINSWPLDIIAKEWLERKLSLEGLFEVYKYYALPENLAEKILSRYTDDDYIPVANRPLMIPLILNIGLAMPTAARESGSKKLLTTSPSMIPDPIFVSSIRENVMNSDRKL